MTIIYSNNMNKIIFECVTELVNNVSKVHEEDISVFSDENDQQYFNESGESLSEITERSSINSSLEFFLQKNSEIDPSVFDDCNSSWYIFFLNHNF